MTRASLAELAESGGMSRVGNADERAAQELGFVTLSTRPASPQPSEEEAPDASLSEAIKGVLVQIGVQQP